MNDLIPIENAWVCRSDNPGEIGFVKRIFATGDEPSIEVDFGPKLALYQRAGVREYVTIQLFGKRIVWRVLQNAVYLAQSVPADGVLRSHVFPGLWLDVAAFWQEDGTKMLAALNAGLSTADHQRFVEALRARLLA